MATAVVLGRLGLAAVFTAAGVGKLMDLRASQRSLLAFGVPAPAASIFGTVLPVAELAIVAALVLQPSARWGGVGAVGLMLVFIGGIGNAIRRGRRPDCGCFGALYSGRAGWTTIARNSALAIVAAFVVWRGPGPTVDGWVSARSAAVLLAIGLGIACAGLVWVVSRVRLENRLLRDRLESAGRALAAVPAGLPVGAVAPGFRIPGEDDAVLTLDSLCAQARPVMLVFVIPGCGPSDVLLPEFERWQTALKEQITIGVVGRVTLQTYDAAMMAGRNLEEDEVYKHERQQLGDVLEAYRVVQTPAAVIVSPSGTIASATVVAEPAIEALVRTALNRSPVSRRGAVDSVAV